MPIPGEGQCLLAHTSDPPCYKADYSNLYSTVLMVKLIITCNINLHVSQWLVCEYVSITCCCRAPRSKKWNFRTQFLENFRTISGYFCRFHEAQDTENARFSVLIFRTSVTFQEFQDNWEPCCWSRCHIMWYWWL